MLIQPCIDLCEKCPSKYFSYGSAREMFMDTVLQCHALGSKLYYAHVHINGVDLVWSGSQLVELSASASLELWRYTNVNVLLLRYFLNQFQS